MPHDHGHAHIDPDSGDRRVSIAIWANGLLTVAQIVGGILSGSLALIADALHNFSDMASLVIAFAARKIARRPADERMTFGYGRVEIVAALINYTTLILIGFYLIYEGGMRMIDPPEVQGWTVVILGGVALVVDTLTALLTYSMQKGSVNIRALFLHNLSDALASVAVIVGGSLIILYDMRWVDPAITIGIALYILYLAITEIGGPIRTLMLGSPPDIDNGTVVDPRLQLLLSEGHDVGAVDLGAKLVCDVELLDAFQHLRLGPTDCLRAVFHIFVDCVAEGHFAAAGFSNGQVFEGAGLGEVLFALLDPGRGG